MISNGVISNLLNTKFHTAMNEKVSSLSSFIKKLDAEILKEDQVILLKGGFVSTPLDGGDANKDCPTNKGCSVNDGCPVNNCDCTITTDDCKAHL